MTQRIEQITLAIINIIVFFILLYALDRVAFLVLIPMSVEYMTIELFIERLWEKRGR